MCCASSCASAARGIRTLEYAVARGWSETVVKAVLQANPAAATTLDPIKMKHKFDEASWTPKRKFQAYLLMGAEMFLAAMLFQIIVSRLFEPIDLAAIVATRSFSAVRGSNPYKHDKHKRRVEVDAGDEEAPGLAYARETFKISSEWMIVDALNAIKWALVFVSWSNEAGADTFAEFFLDMLRLADGHCGFITALL